MGKRSQTTVLLDNYNMLCNDIVAKFCVKQGLDFDGWVSDEIGSIAIFSAQYSFNISDIVLDLKNKQPKGLILSWYNNNVQDIEHWINYYSYTKRLRCSDIKDY